MKPVSNFPSRTEQVYVSIRESICDGDLEPGTHLVQEELAAKLGVSRQPVQQAVILLKSDGLVFEQGARGLYVAPLDTTAMKHRYQIRIVLDQLAARLVAEQATKSPSYAARLLAKGTAILESGEAAVAKGLQREAVSFDVRFHSFLYEMSGNPMLASTAAPHWHHLRRMMIAILRFAERGSLVWGQHRETLEALVRGDVAQGEDLVTAHVLGAQDALMKAVVPEQSRNEAILG